MGSLVLNAFRQSNTIWILDDAPNPAVTIVFESGENKLSYLIRSIKATNSDRLDCSIA